MSLRRRLLVTVATGVGVLVLLIAVGVYGLIASSSSDPTPSPNDRSDSPAEPEQLDATTPAPAPPRARALPHTTDPLVYARAVAETLLTWDTMSATGPGEHARPVLADADPEQIETPGLASDVTNFLPTPDAWQQLRHYHTTQTATIHAAYIPDTWDDIVASDGARHLRDGTLAVTIEATRHRAGTWLDQPATADHPVTFTVFVACPPAFDRCHLLRLSQVDDPLP